MSFIINPFVFGDPDVAAFIAASGATDTTTIAQLVAYLKAESLWTSCRFFPFKSAQNAGTGTTVYGLGGWTSNNITLVNGPTWGSTGVAFDATNDRATWDGTGIASLSELYTFDRQLPTNASLADNTRFGVLAFGDIGALKYGLTHVATGTLAGETLAIGINVSGDTRRLGTSAITWSAGTSTHIISRFASSGSALWKSKTVASSYLTSGTQNFSPSVTTYSADSVLNINAQISSGTYSNFVATTRVAILACKTSLTQTQRETITDYLDAL